MVFTILIEILTLRQQNFNGNITYYLMYKEVPSLHERNTERCFKMYIHKEMELILYQLHF